MIRCLIDGKYAERAADELVEIGIPAVPFLLDALQRKKDERTLVGVCFVLRRLNPKTPEVVNALIPLLDHPIYYVRENAVRILGDIGPDARPAVKKITAQLDKTPALVRVSIEALKKIDCPASIEALVKTYAGGSTYRDLVTQAVMEMKSPIRAPLRFISTDGNRSMRNAAKALLACLDRASATPNSDNYRQARKAMQPRVQVYHALEFKPPTKTR